MYFDLKRKVMMFSLGKSRKYTKCSTLTLCSVFMLLFLLFNALTNFHAFDPEDDALRRRNDDTAGSHDNVDYDNDGNKAVDDDLLEVKIHSPTQDQQDLNRPNEFQSTLMNLAENGIIMLCVVDTSNLYFALNVYDTSIRMHNIWNYLFISTTTKVSEELKKRNLNHFAFFNDDGKATLNSNSKEYQRRLLMYKREVAAEALKVQLRPLIIDPTIHLFRNPIPELLAIANMEKYDIIGYGGGILVFALFLPTENCAEMYKYIDNYKGLLPGDTDDEVINSYLQWMLKREENPLQVYTLDQSKFISGEKYFILEGRQFYGDSPCHRCFFLHNDLPQDNINTKVYRMREHQMWYLNINDYYSDPLRKYLQVALDQQYSQERQIRNALQLGWLLHRTVILPKFYCDQDTYTPRLYCNLTVKFRKYGVGSLSLDGLDYREHMFLQHPLVPPNIKQSISAESDMAAVLKLSSTQATIGKQKCEEIESMMRPFEGYSVISVSGLRDDIYVFDQQLDMTLESMFAIYR